MYGGFDDAVERGERSSCDRRRGAAIKATATSGYFTTALAEERGAASSLCPWTIEADAGQRINLTLYSFAETPPAPDHRRRHHDDDDDGGRRRRPDGYGPHRPSLCFEIAVLQDGAARKPVTVCGDEDRQMPLLWSETSVVSIVVANPRLVQSLGTFVFHYQGSVT